VEHEYRSHLAQRQAALAAKERAHAWFSNVRLAIVATGGVLLLVLGLDGLVWLLVPLAAFIAVSIAHGQLLNARDRAASAVAFFERGLARMSQAWIGRGRTGEELRPADHLYAHDLDLFGRASVFELLATTRTRAGDETLAQWLLVTPTREVTIERQVAVRELSGRLDLREQVAVLGDELRAVVGVDTSILRQWSQSPVQLRGAGKRMAMAILAAASASTLIWWYLSGSLGGLALALLVVQVAVGQWFKSRVALVTSAVEAPSHDLDLLAALLRTLEREQFQSPYLERLRHQLGTREHSASVEIATLARSVALLASRRNVLFAPISAFLLWATQCAFAIEHWRERAGVLIPRWLDAVGELEALLALGGFAAEHPAYVFPEILEGAPQLDATRVAHPAMSSDAVPNDLALGERAPHLVVVSGSNMSGKSTFLRALGVNVVLSQMGAPVRAARFRLSSLGIGASISVHDSLTDGRSRFFAEITRLKQIVDLTTARRGAVLFLLDEILSGTNSHDRGVGAEALLQGLVRDGAIGLVTTHDLALGEIVARIPTPGVNMHFEDQFRDGTLTFDYTLRPGIVRTSNAVALMRAIGLEV
jgi:hypothetical protein